MTVEFSPTAIEDLQAVLVYIAADNPARAASFVDEIVDHCLAIPDFPEAAPLREELGAEMRVRVYGNYLILHRQTGDQVRIERVLHGRRRL